VQEPFQQLGIGALGTVGWLVGVGLLKHAAGGEKPPTQLLGLAAAIF